MTWRPVRIALLPLALLCIFSIRMLAKVGIVIRFGEIWSARIGHMAGNMESYLCERSAGMQKGIDIFAHNGAICSEQLAKMLGRRVFIDPTRFVLLLGVVNRVFGGWEKHAAFPVQLDRDIHNLYEKYPPHLELTAAEHRDGSAGLRKLGIPPGAKWVCLMVRDSAYLPHMTHHNYRDSDIDTYRLAALALAARGYYVIRMGAKVLKPLNVDHPKVIDLATNGLRTDFMAIYLSAHCAFCISNGTGMDAVPVIFRRPMCYVNYVPLEYLPTFHRNSLAIWKHHMKDGRRMTLKEIYESECGQFMASHQFEDAGITLTDNTPEEIRDAVMEMAGPKLYCEVAQSTFWADFPRSISPYNKKPLHGKINMRIGSKFLEQYIEPAQVNRAA